jgi:hypothetical protein
MTSRERLLNVLNGRTPDRTPVTLFVTDTDIEDGPPDCIIGNRTGDTIGDLMRFHEVLGIDIMLRIGRMSGSLQTIRSISFTKSSRRKENSRKHLIWKVKTFMGNLLRTG